MLFLKAMAVAWMLQVESTSLIEFTYSCFLAAKTISSGSLYRINLSTPMPAAVLEPEPPWAQERIDSLAMVRPGIET